MDTHVNKKLKYSDKLYQSVAMTTILIGVFWPTVIGVYYGDWRATVIQTVWFMLLVITDEVISEGFE